MDDNVLLEDDYVEPEIYISFNIEFRAIRVIENRIIPTTWKLKSNVIYLENDTDEEATSPQYDFRCQHALQKIRFWFTSILADAIFFERNNPFALKAFIDDTGKEAVDNRLVILPEEPGDGVLAQIFHSKMNAFATDLMVFDGVQLSADDMSGISIEFIGDGEINLPSMEIWVGDRAYHEKPWWARDDASTYDLIPDEDADLNIEPMYAYRLDFLASGMAASEELKARVYRPDFKPVVIDGGN